MRHPKIAALLCSAVALVACSGGGSAQPSSSSATTAPTVTTPTSLSKADFISRADDICGRRNDQLAAIPSAGDDPQLVAGVLQQSGAIVGKALGELRKLPIPAGDDAALNAYYSKVDELLAQTSTLAAAYRSGDVPKAKDLQTQALQLQTDANALANAYGLTACGA